VAICGSGVGASVCANKVQGVRAALIHDHLSARQGVEDDHMNIICMGGRTIGPSVAWDLVDTFVATQFSGAERHLRRLQKVASLGRVARRYRHSTHKPGWAARLREPGIGGSDSCCATRAVVRSRAVRESLDRFVRTAPR
jgi:hypothetical protein